MSSRPTIFEQIAEMRATEEARNLAAIEERKAVRYELSQLTSNVNEVKVDMSGMRSDVSNINKNMADFKTDVKDGFMSLSSSMDGHFNGKTKNRGAVKKGALGVDIPSGIIAVLYGLYEFGKLV